ncbi:Lcl C-terminal domain-containing protein [Chondromyces apiculatus]|uniref:Lcl C-terminal domain-containing protein n=1 Tax=Chondromyces apiculatus TaxID=51 RepID=UPI0005C67D4D|nr:DUF1566 domain-containing protein [Chondromyces apiculatus]
MTPSKPPAALAPAALAALAALATVSALGCTDILGIEPGLALCDATWAHWVPGSAQDYETTQDTALDPLTHLRWTRSPQAAMTHADASAACEALSFDDEGSYRLPTRIELLSLLDYKLVVPIDTDTFLVDGSLPFWTSSFPVGKTLQLGPDEFLDTYVLTVETSTGNVSSVDHNKPENLFQSLCVRLDGLEVPSTTAAACPDRYTAEEGDTVYLDRETGLRWERTFGTNAEVPTLAEAEARCAALPLAGGGWRLPTIAELQTIVDESTKSTSAYDPRFDGSNDYYWTSTTDAANPLQTWVVSFFNGEVHSFPTDGTGLNGAPAAPKSVRCVR